MSEYLNTPNAKLLENILDKTFKSVHLSKNDAMFAVTEHRRANAELRTLVMKGFAFAILKYVDEKGAVSKGEVTMIGSRVISAHAWQISQHIFGTSLIYDNIQTSVKNILIENNVQSSKLHYLLELFDESRAILFPDIVKANSLVWFKNKDICMNYVDKNLTNKVNNDSHRYSFIGRERKEKVRKLYDKLIFNPDVKETSNEEALKDELSTEQFSRKYGLDDSFYVSQTKISKIDMERALFDGGLIDSEERRKVLSMIVRNYSFYPLLMVKGTEYFSREKIRTFASIYSERDYEEREELLSDFQKVFLKK